jgi:hypothetical protein
VVNGDLSFGSISGREGVSSVVVFVTNHQNI